MYEYKVVTKSEILSRVKVIHRNTSFYFVFQFRQQSNTIKQVSQTAN